MKKVPAVKLNVVGKLAEIKLVIVDVSLLEFGARVIVMSVTATSPKMSLAVIAITVSLSVAAGVPDSVLLDSSNSSQVDVVLADKVEMSLELIGWPSRIRSFTGIGNVKLVPTELFAEYCTLENANWCAPTTIWKVALTPANPG